LGSYLLWGFFPLYFLAVAAASAQEVVAHRIVWTFALAAAGVFLTGRRGRLVAVLRQRRLVGKLWLAGALVTANWSIYVWAVLNDRLIDASLGYFVNPLVTVALAMAFLGERPRRLQLAALAVASSAVVVIAVWYGQVPWVALLLALTFGAYGLIKKQVDLDPLVGLAVETSPLAPFAAAFIVFLQATGAGTLTSAGPVHTVALLLAGVVTAAPLLLFAAAANRIPLSTLGLLQYACPVLQFLLGVTVFAEPMPTARWFGFGLVWLALAILTVDLLRPRAQTVQVSGPVT
jgi:chloramphenicol-sensitive protein RarD